MSETAPNKAIQEPIAAEPPLTSEDASALAAAKDRKKRRAHKRHGGHEELNIYSMLDLMTIILVFLIKSWQSDTITVSPEVRPPASTITDKPTEAVRVFLTPDRVLLDDKEVAAIRNGDVAPQDADRDNPYLLPRLSQGLAEKAEHFLKIEAAGGAKFEGRYSIVADRKVPWALLKKIMFTAGQTAVPDDTGLERSFGDARLITRKVGE
jgi:biopolymer transport protein ExbD